MRIAEKLALTDKIGRELQSRYNYTQIDFFLTEFGIKPPENISANSKWIYSTTALKGISNVTLLKIAEELEIAGPGKNLTLALPPLNWRETKLFRLFISHISVHKNKATRLKECLAPYAINGFVAHEDIHPTLEWQEEIERALRTMDAFIAIHTVGFSQSVWTQQEIGFAIGRGTKIISFKMGEDPTGFISKQQALARRGRSAEEIASEINSILEADYSTSTRLMEAKDSINTTNLDDLDDEIPF